MYLNYIVAGYLQSINMVRERRISILYMRFTGLAIQKDMLLWACGAWVRSNNRQLCHAWRPLRYTVLTHTRALLNYQLFYRLFDTCGNENCNNLNLAISVFISHKQAITLLQSNHLISDWLVASWARAGRWQMLNSNTFMLRPHPTMKLPYIVT